VLDSEEIASCHHHPSQVLIILFANGTIHSCSSILRHGIIGWIKQWAKATPQK
jgi:hypothetical protein